MMTARTARFNRDDVAERSVPLSFLAPVTRVGEEEMAENVLSRRNAIMGDLLSRMAEIADRLAYIKSPRLGFRMADFAAFGWIMHAQEKNGQWVSSEWEALLGKLTLAQDRFVGADSGLISVLDHLLTERWEASPGATLRWSIHELFNACRDTAIKLSIMLPKTVLGFGQMLTQRVSAIETELDVVIREERENMLARAIHCDFQNISSCRGQRRR